MGKLHEVLAIEKTTDDASKKMLAETLAKFNKPAAYFEGVDKSLSMLAESDANAAAQEAAREQRELITTVHETLHYALAYYGRAEDVKFQKSVTNQSARADIVIEGQTIAEAVPVDALLGLEARLGELRRVFDAMPTQNAAVEWIAADTGQRGAVKTKTPQVQTKTEKRLVPVTLAPATDKHPAQIEKTFVDEVVGRFTTVKFSGAATSQQKADALDNIDKMIVAVKRARMRANSIDAANVTISDKIVPYLLKAFA